jgi:hypothetical protein
MRVRRLMRRAGTDWIVVAADHGFIDVARGPRAAGDAGRAAQAAPLRRRVAYCHPLGEGFRRRARRLARRARRRDAEPDLPTKAGSAPARRTRASPSASATWRW